MQIYGKKLAIYNSYKILIEIWCRLFYLRKRASKLVWARSAFAVAIYAFKSRNNIVNFHAFDKARDALQVAVATAEE